ncbi:hypothetical protein PgNI_05426 [Pyricularia grisea]|uniref:Uncharacterized protein n=1 Tax=Pyricularia grisea TaxID=148305 RepID=A0A6P8B4G1_PYRGI|nr:hypothetical protein PgNI_05426 [Pyricularia grisea]TLD10192.1 hypothetical protein PgNI_05426 [Pyricularia grisea]
MPGADASDIGHRPEDDEFVDINGDGKADYACSRVVWLNNDLEILSWLAQDKTAGGIGVNGRKCPAGEPARYCSGELHGYMGGLVARLKGCDDLEPKTFTESPRRAVQVVTASRLALCQRDDSQSAACQIDKDTGYPVSRGALPGTSSAPQQACLGLLVMGRTLAIFWETKHGGAALPLLYDILSQARLGFGGR